MKSTLNTCEINDPFSTQSSESTRVIRSCEKSEAKHVSKPTVHTVYSCVGNGSNKAKAGIGLFWGDNHPWNINNVLAQEDGEVLINDKAELWATIRAVEIAREHRLDKLVINSDSRYVVLGINEWINQWLKNNWKTSNGDKVKKTQKKTTNNKLDEASQSSIRM